MVRTTTAELADEERLRQRVTHLQQIVAWAEEVAGRLDQSPASADAGRQRFEAALALAHKVLADRAPKVPDQVRSAVDPEARRNQHGGFYDGYLLDLCLDADSELITALEVLPANADEAMNAVPLLAMEQRAQGNQVAALSMDGLGWRGELLRQAADPAGMNVARSVPPIDSPSLNRGLFPPEQFTVDATGETLTCPAGQTTRARQRTRKDTGWQFSFARQDCACCPLLAPWMAQVAPTKGRSVNKNESAAECAAARQRAHTERYAEVRALHPRVERKLADIVRYHQGRRTRSRGRARVTVQYLLTAVVVNLKRMVKLLFPVVDPYATAG